MLRGFGLNMNNYKITLAGNPNVGKSTIFNILTGEHQHTGNWAGKTVDNAFGKYKYNGNCYHVYDLPGTYSLAVNSKEEEIARDFIYQNRANVTIVICNAVSLERSLNLVLQILNITSNVIVVVNLMDEAKKKGISINLNELSSILGVPVIGTSASYKIGIKEFKIAIIFCTTFSMGSSDFNLSIAFSRYGYFVNSSLTSCQIS